MGKRIRYHIYMTPLKQSGSVRNTQFGAALLEKLSTMSNEQHLFEQRVLMEISRLNEENIGCSDRSTADIIDVDPSIVEDSTPRYV